MLTQDTLETLRHLKLHGMAQAPEEQRDTPNTHALSFEERLAVLSKSAPAELSKTRPAKHMTVGINERSRQKL
jgi:hypothetical protein